jgi:hypothetical protein
VDAYEGSTIRWTRPIRSRRSSPDRAAGHDAQGSERILGTRTPVSPKPA